MEERHNVLVLLRPPSEEDKVRLVLRRKEESESGDFHGWLDNKEVWQVNTNATIPTSPHLTFIRKSLAASLKEPRCWDITVTVSDGVRPLPRLVAALAFPLLQSCEDLLEAEALILHTSTSPFEAAFLQATVGTDALTDPWFVVNRIIDLIF